MRFVTIMIVLALGLPLAGCGGATDDRPLVIRPPNTAVAPTPFSQHQPTTPPASGTMVRNCPITALNC